MENLYETLSKLIISKKLGDNKLLLKFIIKLDQDQFGLGAAFADILKFFKNKSELSLISDLLCEANKNLNYEALNNLILQLNNIINNIN